MCLRWGVWVDDEFKLRRSCAVVRVDIHRVIPTAVWLSRRNKSWSSDVSDDDGHGSPCGRSTRCVPGVVRAARALKAVLAGSEHVRSGGAAFPSWNSSNTPREATVVLFIDIITWPTENSNNLPKATQLAGGRAGFWTRCVPDVESREIQWSCACEIVFQ